MSCCSEILDTRKILQTLQAQQDAITKKVHQLEGELQSQKRQMDESDERLRVCSRNKRSEFCTVCLFV
jgi:hypothetical protein